MSTGLVLAGVGTVGALALGKKCYDKQSRTCDSKSFISEKAGYCSDPVCKPLTQCGAGEYEKIAPTPNSDRVCGKVERLPDRFYQGEVMPYSVIALSEEDILPGYEKINNTNKNTTGVITPPEDANKMCRTKTTTNAFTIRKYPYKNTNMFLCNANAAPTGTPTHADDEQGAGIYMMGYDKYEGVSPDESFYLGIKGKEDCLQKCDETKACGGYTEFKDGSCKLYGKDFYNYPPKLDPGFTHDPDSVFYKRPHMVFDPTK